MTSGINWDFTKIVATIGPASDTVEILQDLITAGMNVARLNTKHGTVDWHAERIDRIRTASKKVGKPIGILLDLQGPEIRVNLKNSEPFTVKTGDFVTLVHQFSDSKGPQIQVPEIVIQALQVGDRFSIDDGICEFEVSTKNGATLQALALGHFTCKDRKTMNTPDTAIAMSSLIDDDLKKLDMAQKHPVDFIALSFVRTATDILELKEEMKKRNITSNIVAKIETQAAIDHLDEIIEQSDAIMVARGDLAVEIPMEELAYRQKEIISRCRLVGKPVITATQMLKSMVESPRPTRAEVSDVANAVYDGSDAVMLSEETTIGEYPVQTVQTMKKIVSFNEQHSLFNIQHQTIKSTTSAVTRMAVSLVEDNVEPIDKIIVLTETGFSAQQLTRHRPKVPVLALTDRQETVLRCTLLYGVMPIYQKFPEGTVENLEQVYMALKADDLVKAGEKILVIHGTIFQKPGFTNTVSVITVE